MLNGICLNFQVRYGSLMDITHSAETSEPQLGQTGPRIIDIVRAAYADGAETAEALGDPAIGREGLEAAVDFCASQHCIPMGSFCRGCRQEQTHKGVLTFDDYCAQYASIALADTGLTIQGKGNGTLTAPSLAALASSWVAEETWFLARRVHRRLLKAEVPRPKKMLEGGSLGEGPAIVLINPQMADNIGMVARAMANFGLDELRLVAPRDGWPNEKARAAASGANHIIDQARAHDSTRAAVGDLNWICATTARQRHMRKPILTPEQAAAEMARRIAEGERVGVLFGAERQGLENDDIAIADAVVMAPVDPRFASLNLAQAVLLIGYEWLKQSEKGTLGRVTALEQPKQPGLDLRGNPPATKELMIGMFEHLERELDAAGFLKPPEKRTVMVRNIRTMLERMGASEQEVHTFRGIIAALTGAHKRRPPQP